MLARAHLDPRAGEDGVAALLWRFTVDESSGNALALEPWAAITLAIAVVAVLVAVVLFGEPCSMSRATASRTRTAHLWLDGRLSKSASLPAMHA